MARTILIPTTFLPTMLFYISGNKYTFDKIIEKAVERREMGIHSHTGGTWQFAEIFAGRGKLEFWKFAH